MTCIVLEYDGMVVATEFYDRRPRRVLPEIKTKQIDSSETVAFNSSVESVTDDRNSNFLEWWTDIESRYERLHDELMSISKCTYSEARCVLEHIPGFVILKKTQNKVFFLAQKPYAVWDRSDVEEFRQLLRSCEKVMNKFESQVLEWKKNPSRLERVINNLLRLFKYDNNYSKRQWMKDLNERRAYIRANVLKAKIRLKYLTNKTPHELSLEKSLYRFEVLEDFPNQVTEEDDAFALQKILVELEAYLESILPSLSIINSYNTIRNEKSEKVAVNETSQHELSGEENNKELLLNNEEISTQNFNSSTSMVETEHEDILGLGTYDIQIGDNMYDILYGETEAPSLPLLDVLKETQKNELINSVMKVLDSNSAYCKWLGIPYPATELPDFINKNTTFSINLDNLHDLISLEASKLGFILIPDTELKKINDKLQQVTHYYNLHVNSNVEREKSDLVTIESIDDILPALKSYFSFKQVKNQSSKHSPKSIEEN